MKGIIYEMKTLLTILERPLEEWECEDDRKHYAKKLQELLNEWLGELR